MTGPLASDLSLHSLTILVSVEWIALYICYRFEYPPDLHQYSSYYDDPYGYYGDYNGQRWDPLVQAWVQQNAGIVLFLRNNI